MDKADIIKLAKESGILWLEHLQTIATSKTELERFASLVAAHEREECINQIKLHVTLRNERDSVENKRAAKCIEAIRSRKD